MSKEFLRMIAIALLFFASHASFAQTTAAAPPADQSQQQLLSAGQLDALVAPIALYPDALLSEVLMASTYPLEVVEADRWADANKNLKGDALKGAVDKQSWDDSVKSLTATPDVLDMMSSKLDWTQQLGDAVLAQQPDVMDAIQRLRSKAQANNKLTSNKQQTVSTQQQNGQPVIVIAPTDPNYVYVPYYDPGVVYGSWPYPAYPPYYWPTPGYIAGGVIATGLAFGAGYAIGRWASGGCCWGGGFNWGGNNITVNRNVNINNIGGNNWNHNPAHRAGVRYNNTNVAAKFGGNRANIANGAGNRMDFRGRSGNQVLNPGAGGGNRPGGDAVRAEAIGLAPEVAANVARRTQAPAIGRAAVAAIGQARAAANHAKPGADVPAETVLAIWVPVVLRVSKALAAAPALVVAAGASHEAAEVAALHAAAEVAAACAAVEVADAVVAVVAVAPTSGSSTTSCCSAALTMASAFIASPTTAVAKPMSA